MPENTYKTILFDKFKDCGNNLAIYLKGCKNPASDEILSDLEKLTVHSFDEFVKKFSPDVYQNVKNSEDGFIIEYTFEANDSKPVSVTDTPYFKMLLNLCRKKGDSKQSNRDFDYNSVLESLLPKKVAEKAMEHRYLLENTLDKYYEAEKKGTDSSEYEDQYNDILDDIKNIYSDSIQGLLPLAIADTTRKINYIEKNVTLPAPGENALPMLGTGELVFGENGELVVRQIAQSKEGVEQLPMLEAPIKSKNEIQLYIADSVKDDYEAYIEEGNEDNKTKRELILSSFSPCSNISIGDMSADEIENLLGDLHTKKNMYENAYKSFVEGFANQMAPLVEKILAVKLYFDHASIDGELPKGCGLVVANCTPADLLDESVKDKFSSFMKHYGAKARGKEKIWLGILPNVKDNSKLVNKAKNVEKKSDGPMRKSRLKNTSNATVADSRVSINDTMQLLEILESSRVLTFFSCKAAKENIFAGIDEKYIYERQNTFEEAGINGEYATFVYPNFSVMNLRKMNVAADTMQILEDENYQEKLEMTIPAIYLDSCYVAAGLVAGSQQHKWLSKRGIDRKYLADDLPCVHINLENRDVQSKLTTFMNRELTTSWNDNIKKAINDKNFGFVFSSDYFEVNGKPVNNTYVLCARNMNLGDSSNRFMPIYTALVKNYVYAELQKNGYRTSNEVKKHFIKGTVEKWRKDIINRGENCINLLLYTGENISWDDNRDGISITFGQNEVFMDMDDNFIKTEENK